jgi:O-antigen/teichoic acid export membrane protein
LGYSLPLFFSALVFPLYRRLDLFMLKMLGATIQMAGVYGVSQRVSALSGVFVTSFSPLLVSTLARTFRGNDPAKTKEMGRNAMRVVIGLLPFVAIAGGAASEIVSWIFGPAFAPAGGLLSLLVFGTLAINLISVTTAILTAAGHPRWTLALTGPLVPLAAISHFYVIPRFGALGAASVTTSLAVLGAFLSILLVKSLCQIPAPWATFLRASLVSVLAYAFAHFWPTPGPLVLVKLGVISLSILLPLLFLEGLKGSELAFFRNLFGLPEPREEIVEED